jgi:hypothetical protein
MIPDSKPPKLREGMKMRAGTYALKGSGECTEKGRFWNVAHKCFG